MYAHNLSRQRGMTLIWVALVLLIFLGIAALAIDAGMLYTAKNSAQNAADAAALAGAYTFTNSAATQPDAAQQAAIRIASQNKVQGDAVSITADDVLVDTTNQRVTVTVRRSGANGVAAYFAKILGYETLSLGARATAEAGVGNSNSPGSASHCLKPIFIPNTILASNDTNSVPVKTACANGQVIFNSDGTVTGWATSQFTGGSYPKVVIRNGDPHEAATDVAPSQYYSLDFGSGASTYRCSLGQCLNNCGVSDLITCTNNVNTLVTENGRMTGPTISGINDMIKWPNGGTDQWINGSSPSEFKLGDGSFGGPDSRSLGVAAVWNNCTNLGGSLIGPGKQSMPVLGFIEIFVDGVTEQGSGGDKAAAVTAHILPPIACNQVVDGGTTPPPGNMTIPIRLVQTPVSSQ